MNNKSFKPYITELEIRYRISQLARQISDDYAGREFIVIAVLKGAFMFTADLLRRLHDQGSRPETDFIRARSYEDKTYSTGSVKIDFDATISMEGRDVLLVDDIADSGRTLNYLVQHLYDVQGVADVRTCVLLDKPSRRAIEFVPDYIGFEIPNKFVIGYGIDHAERYRYLPFISVLDSNDSDAE